MRFRNKKLSSFGATYSRSYAIGSLFLLVIAIRVALIGSAPYADEGHYAAAAYFQYLGYTKGQFAPDSFIPPFGGLELYPLLASWIYFIPAEPYFLLRVADALYAAFSGVMLYKYLHLATGQNLPSYLAAVLTIVAVNHPEFIEAGARNPIQLATLLIYCSLYLLERDQGRRIFLPAICLAAAVLIREPFVMFAGIVVLLVWFQIGMRKAIGFFLVATIFATLVIFSVAILKGGIASGVATMFDAYAHSPVTNSDFNLTLSERVQRLLGHVTIVQTVLAFCMPVFIVGIFSPLLAPSFRNKKTLRLYIIGVGLFLAPLIEILSKKPYPYHLAQMFIGFGIFASFGFAVFFESTRRILPYWPVTSWCLLVFLPFGHIFLAQDYFRTMRHAAGWSLHFAPVMVLGNWSSPVVNDSYYLKIAAIVRRYSMPGSAILSTSYNVYPLTGTVPVTRKTASLFEYQFTTKDINMDEEVARLIRDRHPVVFVEDQAPSLQVGERIDPIGVQIASEFGKSIDVGPGLSPYRLFAAKVHVNNSQLKSDTGRP